MNKVIRWIVRGIGALMVTMVSLVGLCLVLIYLPPVQKLIIDKVLDSVSQDMEFSVSVGDVRIGFPLDVHLEDVTLIRKADGRKMMELSEAEADVCLMSMLDGMVSADSIVLCGLTAHTDTLIAAAAIDGEVGAVKVYDADWNLEKCHLSVMAAALQSADLDIVLNDSVAEDSTEDSEAVLKTVNVGVLSLNDIVCDLTLPTDNDTTCVGGRLSQGVLSAMLDLERERYIVRGVDVDGLSGQFSGSALSTGSGRTLMALLENCDLELPEMSFHDNVIRAQTMTATVNHSCQLNITNAYYNLNSGDVSADASVEIDDLKSVTDILPAEMLSGISIPAGSMLTADVKLRNKDIMVGDMGLTIPDVVDVQLREVSYNMDSSACSASVAVKVMNSKPLMAMLPKEMAQMFRLPNGVALNADVTMADGVLSVKDGLLTTARRGRITVDKACYDMNHEAYDVDMAIDRMFVSQFVNLPEAVYMSGHVKARGRGFDFLAANTYTDVSVRIDSMAYGQYNLTNLDADVDLHGSVLKAEMNVMDRRMQGIVAYDGLMTHQQVDGHLTLNIGEADLQALNVSETPMDISTYAFLNLSTDMKQTLAVDAGVMGLDVNMDTDSVWIDEFVAYLNASDKETALYMYSGDMDIEMQSPLGYEDLFGGYVDVAEVVMEQMKSMQIDASKWKERMPEAKMTAHIGVMNPVSDLLMAFDVWFDKADMDMVTSSDVGLECQANITNLQVADFKADNIAVDINEDTTTLNYDILAKVPEQTGLKAFTATLGGHLKDKELQTRLHYYDEDDVEGIDFGLRAQVTDTMLCMDVYPYSPVLGYRQFEVSDTNYINLHKKNRIFADVTMKSKVDSCEVSIVAEPQADQLQDVHLKVKNLNLAPMIAVMPFMPSITGMVKGDMSYVQGIDTTFSIGGDLRVDDLTYERAKMGDIGAVLKYNPLTDGGHQVYGLISRNDEEVMQLDGRYNEELDAEIQLDSLPLNIVSALAPEMPVALEGKIGGYLTANGPADDMHLDGFITPINTRLSSRAYSMNFGIENDTIFVHDSKINFDRLRITSAGENPITMRGEVDLSDITNPYMDIGLMGKNVKIVDAAKTKNAELYGKVNGDLAVKARGTTSALDVTGQVTLLNSSDVTYIMTNTALSVGYRLDDIVSFKDFSLPPDTTEDISRSFFGLDMNLALTVEEGARMKCIFSADGKSYIDVTGGGALTMIHTPEGVTQLTGRYTIDKGDMHYSNSVIPLKSFTISDGSYVEFTGDPMNPKLALAATERVRTSVSNSDKSTRMVTFNTGLRLSNTLKNLGLEFTIDAPEDVNVQQELASLTAEEKNKLALSMLATGMYVAGSNSSTFSTTNALNNFLQGEINNLAGKAISSTLKMDMNLGMEQTTSQDGDTHTDYSFKFSKRLFSDRLNILVGGIINTSGNQTGNGKSGTYINDVSMEWRLDKSGTQYVRLFHDVDYNNLIEGALTENGGGVVLRKKVNDWKDLWKLFQIKK